MRDRKPIWCFIEIGLLLLIHPIVIVFDFIEYFYLQIIMIICELILLLYRSFFNLLHLQYSIQLLPKLSHVFNVFGTTFSKKKKKLFKLLIVKR